MVVDILGVPMDFGQDRRGVDMGPSAIRYAGLKDGILKLGHTIHAISNIDVPIPEMCQSLDSNLRNLDCVFPVARDLMHKTAESVSDGHFPIVLGGDHSLSLGSVRGAAQNKRLGLIWVDAHADFNTPETTPSGNIHGMPLAALAGLGHDKLVGLGQKVAKYASRAAIEPAQIVIVGARDLDPKEKENLRNHGIRVFSMHEIDSYGIRTVMQQAIDIASRDTEGIYLSLDMDSIDPLYAPGVGTAVQGGLTYREGHLIAEMIAETGKLIGLDVVEVNPILDDRNRTAELAVEIILSALGKRVW